MSDDSTVLPELDINTPPPPCKPPKQPDATERLEAWLAGSPDRFVEQGNWNRVIDGSGGFRVSLGNRRSGLKALAFEHYVRETEGIAIATQPGLNATIHAAIDRAEELGL